MNLIIDIGNTRVKAAVFESDRMKEVLVFDEVDFFDKIDFFLKKYKINNGILSTVKNLPSDFLKKLEKRCPILLLNGQTKVPFINKYATKGTLGVDRVALVANASLVFQNRNVLIIDAGTCITYDFINTNNEYLGGAISPGINMRYDSLNNFTSKLPKLEKTEVNNFIGNSTESSMHSGVINGVLAEISSFIINYKAENEDLTVVLTGGDTYFLAKQLKSSIFANPNFVLEGLNRILIYNTEEC